MSFSGGMSFSMVPVDAARDAPLLHDWMGRDYAGFWGMLSASQDEVEAEYARIAADPNHHAWLGLENGQPAFLMESYAPEYSPLAGHYAVQPGDTGMHLLTGPALHPRSGFTTAVFRAVLDFLFADERTRRIVVEPDVRNTKIAVLNARMGFVPAGIVSLPDKEALLSFCTRSDYARSLTAPAPSFPAGSPADTPNPADAPNTSDISFVPHTTSGATL